MLTKEELLKDRPCQFICVLESYLEALDELAERQKIIKAYDDEATKLEKKIEELEKQIEELEDTLKAIREITG